MLTYAVLVILLVFGLAAEKSQGDELPGNRIFAETTVQSASSFSEVNQRSQGHVYDRLSRLINSQVGAIDFSGSAPQIVASTAMPTVRETAWLMDNLGNLTGDLSHPTEPLPGKLVTGDLDNELGMTGIERFERTHGTDGRNQIAEGITGGDVPGSTVQFVYDRAGNLVSDGEYFYQYDASNRLIQVNLLGDITFSGNGEPSGTPGYLLKHYTYDGLGRLIRTQSPYPSPGSSMLRSERFYYDGLQRVQEIVHDPVEPLEPIPLSQDLQAARAESLATEPEVDLGTSTMSYEAAQEGDDDPQPPTPAIRMEREYVWGPGNFDELLVQFHRSQPPVLVLQDAGGDVVAGAAPYIEDIVRYRVAVQYGYDAYGELFFAEHFHPHARLFVGHKGLFFDRLDAPIVDAQGDDSPRLVPYAHGHYHNRNRVYSPALQRFMQRDPNATALALLTIAARHGQGAFGGLDDFDLEAMYGDGLNLYTYLGSNPWGRHDPLDLQWDPFDMVDDFLAESLGQRMATLSAIGQDSKAAGVVLATIASYLPFPAASIMGEAALRALGESTDSEMAMGMALAMVPGGKLGAKLGSVLGSASGHMWKAAGHMARYAGVTFLARKSSSLMKKARELLRAGARKGLENFDGNKAMATGLEQVGDGYTRAGRHLLKHGNLIGVDNVQRYFRSDKTAINMKAHEVLTKIVGNVNAPGAQVRANGRIFVPLPGGRQGHGALFEADGTFRSFAGRGL